MRLVGDSSPRKESMLRTLLATAVAVIVGLALIAFTGGFERTTFRLMLQNVGSFLIATVGLALLWELVTKQSLLHDIRAMFRLSESLSKSGISGFELAEDNEWILPVANSQTVDILFGYHGDESWPSSKTLENLVKGISPTGTIRAVIPHPTEDAVLRPLEARLPKEVSQIRSKLKEIRSDLLALARKYPGLHWDLRVIRQAPHFSYMRCDRSASVLLCKHVHDQDDQGKSPLLRLQEGGEQFDGFTAQFKAILESEQALPLSVAASST